MTSIDIARSLIHKWEGCRLTAYPDPATGGDPWTIGYGATGPDITEGTVWTQQQADDDLEARLDTLLHAVQWPATATPNQIGACLSFAYNEGLHAFLSSTLFRYFKQGIIQGAADQFPAWNIANHQVMEGLVHRRADERRVFLGGTPS